MTGRGASGFTLIEMLVVMVLISISVAIVYPQMHTLREKFDGVLTSATDEHNRKKESFAKFISDGLPLKNISSQTGHP